MGAAMSLQVKIGLFVGWCVACYGGMELFIRLLFHKRVQKRFLATTRRSESKEKGRLNTRRPLQVPGEGDLAGRGAPMGHGGGPLIHIFKRSNRKAPRAWRS